MQPRHECKFHISQMEADVLAVRLSAVLRRDSHADPVTGAYTIRSLYFDDAGNSAFTDKLDGVMHRDKYRIRVYGTPEAPVDPRSPVTIERKRKSGDCIRKDAVRITRRLAGQLQRGDTNGLYATGNPLLIDLAVEMQTKLLRPAVLVEYDREAFTFPVEDVRVTLDRRVRTGLRDTRLFGSAEGLCGADVPMVEALDAGTVVLEVKYNRYLPDFVAALIANTPAQRAAISKYTLCRRFDPTL